MRQFVSLRFWLTIAAFLGLLAALQAVFGGQTKTEAATPGQPAVVERRVDVVSSVRYIQAEAGFNISSVGQATGEMRLFLDDLRVMVIHPGTPGEIRCANLASVGKCVVVADLLGEAVVWFTLLPAEPRASITMAAPSEVRSDGLLLLANGWEVPRADRIERRCNEDTSSLREFIRTFGQDSTSTFDFQLQQVVRVTCLE